MNTVAKSKVEKIINEEIQNQVDAYKDVRDRELNKLIEQFEKKPSEEALKIQKQLKSIDEQKEKLKEALRKTGFEEKYDGTLKLDYEWHYEGNTRSWRVYVEPTLTEHSKQTAEKVKKLKELGRSYGLKIWAGEASEEATIFDSFKADLEKSLT